MTSKALNVGNERSEVQIWPSDWPCAFCGRIKKAHQYRENAEKPWCYDILEKVPFGQRCYQWYKPLDNLTYVELKAKERIPQ